MNPDIQGERWIRTTVIALIAAALMNVGGCTARPSGGWAQSSPILKPTVSMRKSDFNLGSIADTQPPE